MNVKKSKNRKRRRLRELMGAEMITRTDVARELGVSTSYVSGVLRGRKPASWETLERFEDAIKRLVGGRRAS